MRQLDILSLAPLGDGMAMDDGAPVYVPFTLPGETVAAEVSGGRGKLIDVLKLAPDRAAPRCSHYTVCGGCSLQHLPDAAYLDFKHRQVTSALAQQRLEVPVDPVVALPPNTRRRAVFAAARYNGKLRLGFHGRKSHEIIPITDCAVIVPPILALLPTLQRIAQIATPPKDALQITVIQTSTGPDIALSGVGKWFSADQRMQLVLLAQTLEIARISIDGETILMKRTPAVRAGAAYFTPPPAGFLQACEPAEAAMVRLVKEAVGNSSKIADLFAGAGTFTLPLASQATLHAVESDAGALAALTTASRIPALKPVTTETRDLFRRPLLPAELARFDAVVMDPPRAGAEEQSMRLAASKVKRIAMVSCNATTLARDLRILVDGGYGVDRVTPVDQFLWSPHIEIVAALSR